MDLNLKGKRALVTGGSGGIGAAIADRLADEGVTVVVHGRREGPARDVAERIRGRGGRAEVATADLSDTGAPERLIEEVLVGGPIDILIANAGPFSEHRFSEATDEDWIASLAGNLLSAIGCIRPALPGMRDRAWGRQTYFYIYSCRYHCCVRFSEGIHEIPN